MTKESPSSTLPRFVRISLLSYHFMIKFLELQHEEIYMI